jgi:pectinesterase
MIRLVWFVLFLPAFLVPACSKSTANLPKPDIVVAADGSGDFKTIQAAIASIPVTNRERVVVFVKNAIYREKIRVDASFVTLRGQSRKRTRIEFPQLQHDFTAHPDEIGWAVINLNNADDFTLENLTAENTASTVSEHAFTICGDGNRIVITDCDVLSHGADTVSLGRERRGRYYHARCNFSGAVDFVCPRGWCYLTDCNFYAHKKTAAVWHARFDPEMKLVVRNCRFDGATDFNLGRHFADAQFYFLDCKFSAKMRDKPIQRNGNSDRQNIWGQHAYFYNCDRDGTDYPWFANNLSSAPGSPKPHQITAAWTFGGKWNPEDRGGPTIQQLHVAERRIALVFSEPVTVRGTPRLKMRKGTGAKYVCGSGTETLWFELEPASDDMVLAVDLSGGAIIASKASATLRVANLSLPPADNKPVAAEQPSTHQ